MGLSFQILEGKSYQLQFPWVGVVNRSQADINKSVDMISSRHSEKDYFNHSLEYKHLSHRMGSEHLGKMLSNVSYFVVFHPFTFQYFSYLLNKVKCN